MRKIFKAFAIGFLSLFATLGVTACEFEVDTTTKATTTAKPTTTAKRYKIKTSGVVSGLTITPKINGEAIDLSKDYPVGSIIDVDIRKLPCKHEHR